MAGYLNTKAINGFYVATDPATSKRFRGWGDDWRLIQVDLPATFTYLDIRGRDLEKVLTPIVGPDCAGTFTDGGRKLGSPNGWCDELKQKMLRKIGVNGLRYRWESAVLPSGSGCKGDDTSAFTILNSDWLKPGMYKVLTSASTGDREARVVIQDMVRNSPKFYIFAGDVLWPDLPAKGELSQSTKNWMRKNLLNCQAESEAESAAAVETPTETRAGDGETDAQ